MNAKVIVFANNEDKELRKKGQELAASTFGGLLIVNRSPRYFEGSVEVCAAIFIDAKQYPEIVEAYKEAKVKVGEVYKKANIKIFDLASFATPGEKTKTKKEKAEPEKAKAKETTQDSATAGEEVN